MEILTIRIAYLKYNKESFNELIFVFEKKIIYMYMSFKIDFRRISEVYLSIIQNYDSKCGLT